MIGIMRKEYASLRRKPFLTPVWLGAAASVLVLALAVWAVWSASTTLVYVVANAEAVGDGSADPALSPAGEARAARLAALLGTKSAELGVNAIFVTETRRAQQTARPLAIALSVPVIVMPAGDVKALKQRVLSEYRGQRVLVIGHPDTVPQVVKALSGRKVEAASEAAGVYVVAVPYLSRAIVSRLE
jgi:phosphohistidine phosphatase SixA